MPLISGIVLLQKIQAFSNLLLDQQPVCLVQAACKQETADAVAESMVGQRSC